MNFLNLIYNFRCQKYVKQGYMEMTKKIYLDTLKSALGRFIYHYWCFPVNFPKFLRTSFLQDTSWRLLLIIFIQILGRSKIYVYESVNWQSGLVVYLPTTIIFNLNNEMKHIIFHETPRNLKKMFWLSTKCNKAGITG